MGRPRSTAEPGARRRVYKRVMSRQVLGAVLTAACLVSGPASAQFALGSARTPGVTVHRPDPPREEPAPPARPPHADRHPSRPAPAPGSDLFLAGPHTYLPHTDRSPRRVASYPGLSGYLPAAYAPGILETVIVREPIIIEVERPPREPETTTAQPPAPPSEPTVIYVTPPKAKTLYVIPRCYAGDKRPSIDQLPVGCDLSLLRVIPAGAL
jgi:hypothetical protein